MSKTSLLPRQVVDCSSNDEVCVYEDVLADENDVADCFTILQTAFNNTQAAKQSILAAMVFSTRMSKQQLKDATFRVLKTCKGGWDIADIVEFGNVRTYDMKEIHERTGRFPSPEYPLVLISNKRLYVSKRDQELYNLPVVDSNE